MSPPDRPPSFQFYPRDWLSSRSTRLMTPEQRGGYIELLCHAWLSDHPGELPADDETLSRLSGLGDRWAACREAILRAFESGSPDGPPTIRQKRLVEARREQRMRYARSRAGADATNSKLSEDQRRENARFASEVRWHKAHSAHDECAVECARMPGPASASASALQHLQPTAAVVPSSPTSQPAEARGKANGGVEEKDRQGEKPPPDSHMAERVRRMKADLTRHLGGQS